MWMVCCDGKASHPGCIPASIQFREVPEQDKVVSENDWILLLLHTESQPDKPQRNSHFRWLDVMWQESNTHLARIWKVLGLHL